MRNPVWRCMIDKNKKVLLCKYFRMKYFVSKHTLYYFTQITDKMSRLIPLFLQIILFIRIAVRHENIVDKTENGFGLRTRSYKNKSVYNIYEFFIPRGESRINSLLAKYLHLSHEILSAMGYNKFKIKKMI